MIEAYVNHDFKVMCFIYRRVSSTAFYKKTAQNVFFFFEQSFLLCLLLYILLLIKKCSFSNYREEIKRNATLLCKVNPSGCLLHPIL